MLEEIRMTDKNALWITEKTFIRQKLLEIMIKDKSHEHAVRNKIPNKNKLQGKQK